MASEELSRRVFVLLSVLSIALVFALPASALSIDGFDVKVPSSIEAGEDFDVEITFEDPSEDEDDVEITIEITVDGVLVHEVEDLEVDFTENINEEITINSADFRINDGDDDVWGGNLMAYACKDDIEVNVEISGDLDEDGSDDIDIEADGDRELSFELDPNIISLDEEFKVTVYDEDDDELDDVNVRFTWIDDEDGDEDGVWDVDDAFEEDQTDGDGEVEFKLYREIDDDAYGLYQMDIWKDGYCKITEEYSLRNILNISDTEPATPKVGEPFKVKVTTPSGKAATGLWVYLNPGGMKSRVTLEGYAAFTVEAEGTYSLATGGATTGYEETIKTVRISTRPQLTVSVSPETQSIGKSHQFTVKSGGNPVEGSTIKVMRAGGTEQTLPGTTSSAGTITYTAQEIGDYTVKAEKEGYEDATEVFTVKNSFKVEMPSEELRRGSEVTITVKDAQGNAVSGAGVSLEGTTISGVTDQAGRYTFILDEVGSHQVIVRKSGFIEASEPLSSSGTLEVKLDKGEIILDESVKVTVVNSDGIPVEASIRISGPSGTQTYMASEHTVMPEKAGEYTVEASKAGYAKSTQSLKVKPRPLTLTYYFSEDKLILNASSKGQPATGVSIYVAAGGLTHTAVTDEAGVAQVLANASGNYTIRVDNPDYAKTSVTTVKSAAVLSSNLLVPAIVGLLALVLIVIFVVVLVALFQRRGGGSKPSFKRRGGTRLGG